MRRRRWAPEVIIAIVTYLVIVASNALVNRDELTADFRGQDPIFVGALLIGFSAFMWFAFASPYMLVNAVERLVLKRRQQSHASENTVLRQFVLTQQRESFHASAAVAYAALAFSFRFDTVKPMIPIVVIATVITALVHIRLLLVAYRVNAGTFGSTEAEVREIMKFVIAHADDTDFSGGLGAKSTISATTITDTAPLTQGAEA